MDLYAIGMQLVKLVIAIVLAIAAQFLAIKVFDKMTKNIDEMAEIRKGNVAIGIILAAVLLSVANIIAGGVGRLLASGWDVNALLKGCIGLVVAIVIAVLMQFIALSMYGRLTDDIDEEKELKKGNLAVAITLAAVIFGTSLIVSSGLPNF